MISYVDLISSFSVAENKKNYSCLTERHLQVLWFEQKYLHPLYTKQGELIQVISPGIWNTQAGPDFLRAHLRIGTREYKGDIELHLLHEGWYAHGHHLDNRYNEVVLHLSYGEFNTSKPIMKNSGEEVLSLSLGESLKRPIEHLLSLIDLDLYPYKKFTEAGKCAHTLFKCLDNSAIHTFFTAAAYWRLEKKAEYLKFRVLEPSLQFIAGIAMTLGYQHNAEAFLDLFVYLLQYRDLSEQELLAIALGCCGFFDGRQGDHWELSPFFRELKSLWWEKNHLVLHQAALRLDRIRPLNHPVRRLAYLVKLMQSSCLEQLWEKMLAQWIAGANIVSDKEARALKASLMDSIPSYEDLYWNKHFTFETTPHSKHLSLIGEDLKHTILLNTFLPMLYTHLKAHGEVVLLEKFRFFYQNFKAIETSKIKYLKQRFFLHASQEELLHIAQIEQGAYQLHKDFCIHFEASCEGCPFVDRYRACLQNPHACI